MKKATFQKPDATYPHGSLREQPEFRLEPKFDDYRLGEIWEEAMIRYEEQLHSLRTIPCSENNWKDGQELEEGKDYELHYDSDDRHIAKVFGVPIETVAVPIVQETEESQNDLWKEVDKIIHDNWGNWYPALKSKFTIQRRKQ